MTLRELRLWHWRKYKTAANTVRKYDEYAQQWEATYHMPCRHSRRMAKQNTSRAAWHLSAVEALNPAVPGDVAQDDKDTP